MKNQTLIYSLKYESSNNIDLQDLVIKLRDMFRFSFADWWITSTSHKALELVAAVAEVLPVVLKNTYCFFLYSSPVKNFSCSA